MSPLKRLCSCVGCSVRVLLFPSDVEWSRTGMVEFSRLKPGQKHCVLHAKSLLRGHIWQKFNIQAVGVSDCVVSHGGVLYGFNVTANPCNVTVGLLRALYSFLVFSGWVEVLGESLIVQTLTLNHIISPAVWPDSLPPTLGGYAFSRIIKLLILLAVLAIVFDEMHRI